MSFEKQSKAKFIFGILTATTLYAIGLFLVMVVVRNMEGPKIVVKQTISNVRTINTDDGTILKFTSKTYTDNDINLTLIRSYTNIETDDVYLLPALLVYVPSGEKTMNVIINVGKLPPGTYHYTRSFAYSPRWSWNPKFVTQEPISFRVCSDNKEECR